MLQDIFPHEYNVSYTAHSCRDEDLLLCYDQRGLLALAGAEGSGLAFPCCGQLQVGPEQAQYLFSVDGERYFLYTGPALEESAGLGYRALDRLREAAPMWRVFVGMTGAHLWRWYKQRRFCGCCGRPLRHSPSERAMMCDHCHITCYPQISPALIIGVTQGDSLLLTRYADRPYRRFALIAGFVEVGETLEDALRREVWEEVGLQVKNFRYYKSQPWPFSDSLLMGFFCDVEGNAEAHPDGTELAEATWVRRQDLAPDERSPISLTQEMISLFRQGGEPQA